MQSWTPTAGTPQGAVISPLLANLYLHPLDVKMSELGYRFEAGRRWVRHKSLKGFKDKVREKTKRTRGESMRTTIDDLTPMIRGWFGYFKHAHPHTFTNLDGLIRRRLRSILRKQEKRPGMGRCYEDHRRWPNVYFANLGLFTMATAHRASQSR